MSNSRDIPELMQYIQHFKPSRPIFEVVCKDSTLGLEHLQRYENIPTANDGDALSKLAVANFSEQFDRQRTVFTVNHQQIHEKCFTDARVFICKFISAVSGLKNPRYSKIYKFYSNSYSVDSYEMRRGIILVYKYLKENEPDCLLSSFTESQVSKNSKLILDKLYKKYGER